MINFGYEPELLIQTFKQKWHDLVHLYKTHVSFIISIICILYV